MAALMPAKGNYISAHKLPSPYSLLHLTSFPSSPHEIHTQHRVMVFRLTYKSKLPYTHTPKRNFLSTQLNLYLPKGTNHGRLTWKKFSKPHIGMAIMLGTGNVNEGWDESGIEDPNSKGASIRSQRFNLHLCIIKT
jgi:hypothetical protein